MTKIIKKSKLVEGVDIDYSFIAETVQLLEEIGAEELIFGAFTQEEAPLDLFEKAVAGGVITEPGYYYSVIPTVAHSKLSLSVVAYSYNPENTRELEGGFLEFMTKRHLGSIIKVFENEDKNGLVDLQGCRVSKFIEGKNDCHTVAMYSDPVFSRNVNELLRHGSVRK